MENGICFLNVALFDHGIFLACFSDSSALNECNQRLEKGDLQFEGETCTEELFNFLHCVDGCAAGSTMKALK